MLRTNYHEQVVRDVYSKCRSSVILDARQDVHFARGPDIPDTHYWRLIASQPNGQHRVIGSGPSEVEMWSSAYRYVCVTVAKRWFERTDPPLLVIEDDGTVESIKTSIPTPVDDVFE